MSRIKITKNSGIQVPFSPQKLKNSLLRSGGSNQQINQIIHQIEGQLYEGISTKKIYQLAFDLLKKQSKPFAARYKLKTAIMELGPSGFPFENYFSKILAHLGYKVATGQFINGQCVKHEIDVIAEKDKHYYMIECKYHNLLGTACDVKIPLYIHSRFKDVEATWKQTSGIKNLQHQGWLVTNTKFTEDAIQYGTCAGLKLTGWNYPITDNLNQIIDRTGLYPITCMTSLTKYEKQQLLTKKIVLCKEIISNSTLLKNINISATRFAKIQEEAAHLSSGYSGTYRI